MRGEIERLLQVGQRVFVELVLAQFEHRLDGRDDAVAARFGEQRGVIALGLIIVGARQVDDLGAPAGREQFRPREIVAGGDDLVRRFGVGKIAHMIDENDPAGHGVPAEAASRRDAGSRSEAIIGRSAPSPSDRRTPVATTANQFAAPGGRRHHASVEGAAQVGRRAAGAQTAPHAAVASGAGASRFSKRSATRAVLVIAGVMAERAKPHLFVERDRRRVVVAHLEPERLAPARARVAFAGLQQRPADAAAPLGGVDGERIDARRAAALARRQQRVAGEPVAEAGDDQRPARRADEGAQRAARQPVAGESRRLERFDRVESSSEAGPIVMPPATCVFIFGPFAPAHLLVAPHRA